MTGAKKQHRRDEILQALAQMLESSDGSQRITTAKLASQVGVSEAALYRHFPSKASMFEGLIQFIEESLLSRINLIQAEEKDTFERLRLILRLLLGFGEHNRGLSRIMTGHALVFEHDKLQERINLLLAKIETQLRQVLKEGRLREGKSLAVHENVLAAQLICHIEGSYSRFVRSNFTHPISADFDQYWAFLSEQLCATASHMANNQCAEVAS
ncbi:MAG: nucleoid occlusion factor SlmA [Enterovibrio sp.]